MSGSTEPSQLIMSVKEELKEEEFDDFLQEYLSASQKVEEKPGLSASSPGFSSTFGIEDRYSCRKSSNSSSLSSSFTDMISCDGSVDPDISDFSSVFQRKSSQTFIQCKTNKVNMRKQRTTA